MNRLLFTAGAILLLFSLKLSATTLPSSLTYSSSLLIDYSLQKTVFANTAIVKKKKPSFFQRVLYKMIAKKIKKIRRKERYVDADQLARQAHLMGWLAFGFLFVLTPASIPLGILAVVNGTKALKSGTSLPKQARTGKALGIVSLILVTLILVLVIATLGTILA